MLWWGTGLYHVSWHPFCSCRRFTKILQACILVLQLYFWHEIHQFVGHPVTIAVRNTIPQQTNYMTENGLVPSNWQAKMWNNDSLVYWRRHASLGSVSYSYERKCTLSFLYNIYHIILWATHRDRISHLAIDTLTLKIRFLNTQWTSSYLVFTGVL